MAGLVPVQLGHATNGQTGLLVLPAGEDEAIAGFAAILSGVFNRSHVDPKPATLAVSDLMDGHGSVPSAATVPTDPRPVKPEDGTETPLPVVARSAGWEGVASARARSPHSGRSNKVLPAELTTVVGAASAPSKSSTEAFADTSFRSPTVEGERNPLGDAVGQDLESLVLDGNVQAPLKDPTSKGGLLAEVDLERQSGNIESEAPPALPVAASGKNSNADDRTHVRTHRHAGELPVPADQIQVQDGSSGAAVVLMPAAVTPAPQTGTTNLPLTVPTSSSSDVAVGAAAKLSVDGARPVEPHRPASVDPDKAQLSGGDHFADGGASPAALSTTVAEPEKLAVKSDAMPELPAPAMRADVPQASTSATVSSVPSTAPPTAPADQIAPALVGILQKSDGQQSVSVRLQPADLGQVQIRVDQTDAGTAHIAITAERPETLLLLQREEPRLQQILDQAGVLSSGRTVSFQVAPQDQIGASASRPDSMETGAGASGQGQSGGAWRQNGDAQNDFGRGPVPDQGQNRPRWFRAGLDITA